MEEGCYCKVMNQFQGNKEPYDLRPSPQSKAGTAQGK